MGSTARPKHEISDTARIAASPARDCGSSCPRSSADEEGSSWPSGAPVLKRGDATIPILSGRTLQLSSLDAPPAQRVRSISSLNAESAFRVQPRLPQQPPSSTTSAICDCPGQAPRALLSTSLSTGGNDPLRIAHRARDTKPEIPLASVKAEELQCIVDLPPSRNSNLALDTVLAVSLSSVSDQIRGNSLRRYGHWQAPWLCPHTEKLIDAAS